MAVKIIFSQQLTTARITGAWKNALGPLSEEILADCNEYCKEDKGTLIASSLEKSRPQEGKLIWETPYARRQYWDIRTSLTPGRTWKWCETAKRRHLERWRQKAQKGLNDNL